MVDAASPAEFFSSLVASAADAVGVAPKPPTQQYLVTLLTDAAIQGGPDLDTPLALQLANAMATQHLERVQRMKKLGDAALFAAGFAADSLGRRGLTVKYCVTMGQRAYSEAARGRSVVFQDLSYHFLQYTAVLDEVRERTQLRDPLVRLYERWEATDSPVLLQRLKAQGVVPLRFRG